MNQRVTLLLIVLALLTVAALALGPVSIGAGELWRVVTGGADPVSRAIVVDIRAPRVALALLVGAALGMSGAVLQGALRNALAEPYPHLGAGAGRHAGRGHRSRCMQRAGYLDSRPDLLDMLARNFGDEA